METGLVAAVRPVVVVLLAAACTKGTGAAALAVVGDEADVALLAAARACGTGAAALVCAGEWSEVPAPALIQAGGDEGSGTGDSMPCGAVMAGVPACTDRTLGTEVVRSCSSIRKSKAEEAMGVVDISVKGKKYSSKMTCRQIRMRFDWSSRQR